MNNQRIVENSTTYKVLFRIRNASHRDDIIPSYAEAIALNQKGGWIDWATINTAIRVKWSHTALKHVDLEARRLNGMVPNHRSRKG